MGTAPPRTVLLVTPSVTDSDSLQRDLADDPDQAYTVVLLERGDQALEQYRDLRPDCVIISDTLPDTDWVALAGTFQTVLPSAPAVILLVEQEFSPLVCEALRRGAYDYVLRGSPSRRVWWTVRKAIEAADLRASLAQERQALKESAAQVARLVAEREELARKEGETRRLMNEALALLDTLIDSAPIGLAFVDRDLRFVRVNRALAIMNGRPAEEHLGRRPVEIFGDFGAKWERWWQMVLASGEPIVNLEVSILISGWRKYALVSYYPVRDTDGNLLGVGSVVTDISQRKRSEIGQRVLAAAGSMLAASPDTGVLGDVVRTLFPDLADYGMVHFQDEREALRLVAAVHRDQELEAQLATWFGAERLAVSGVMHPIAQAAAECQTLRDVALFSAADEKLVPQELRPATCVIAPLIAHGRCLGALTVVSVEAGRRYLGDEVVVIEELARRCAVFIAAARSYEEVRRARAAAEAAVEQRDRFISTAAHELKTPLAVLLGNAQLLLRRAEQDFALDALNRRNLRIILAQAQRLNRLIATLLDVSRLESGRLVSVRLPVELCRVASQLAEELTPTLIRHVISLDLPDEPVLVAGDELRLEQVVQNLLHNAVKYSPRGGEIRVTVQRSENEALLSVSDQGIGIPEAELPRLFQRHFRASNAEARQIGGMGFGLFIVREIVESHGGMVEVQSVEGSGSTFTVRLPLWAPGTSPAPVS
ncbi:MAG: ATP-binding protein [Chloroflexaceae bacterium]